MPGRADNSVWISNGKSRNTLLTGTRNTGYILTSQKRVPQAYNLHHPRAVFHILSGIHTQIGIRQILH